MRHRNVQWYDLGLAKPPIRGAARQTPNAGADARRTFEQIYVFHAQPVPIRYGFADIAVEHHDVRGMNKRSVAGCCHLGDSTTGVPSLRGHCRVGSGL
jgi:hypothetical protein